MRSDVLLGKHGEVVDRLLAMLDSVQTSNLPQMAVIEGPSGTGKTRIVQEFYERLRERNQEAYWPALRMGDGTDVMRQRKLIGPLQEDLLWPEKTLPTFGWWHFNCETLGTGVLEDVVAAARPQVDAHALPLRMSRGKSEGWFTKGKRQAEIAWRELREAAINEGTSAALEVLSKSGINLVFPESILSFGLKGFRAGKRWREERAQYKGETDTAALLSGKQALAGKDLAQVIADLSTPMLPAVVVIEDLHRMGRDLLALLEALLASKAPVLVVATNWPDAVSNEVQNGFISSNKDALIPIRCPQLGHSDLTELVQAYFDVTPEIAEETARRLDNPLILKLWLESSELRDAYDFTGPEALLVDNEGLPIDALGALEARWGELDRETQMALCLAAAARPDESVPLCEVDKEVLAEAFVRFRPASDLDVAAGLQKAVDPMLWCDSKELTVRFIDVVFADHARRHSAKRLRGDATRQFRVVVRARIAEELSQSGTSNRRDPAFSRNSHLAMWFLELDSELNDREGTPDLEYLRSSANLQLSEQAADRMLFSAASQHASAALQHLQAAGVTGEELLRLQLKVAEGFALVSKRRSAGAVYDEILQHEDLPPDIAVEGHVAVAKLASEEKYFEKAARHQSQAIDIAIADAGTKAVSRGAELQRVTVLHLALGRYLASAHRWREVIAVLQPVLDRRLEAGYPPIEMNNKALERQLQRARQEVGDSKSTATSAEDEQRAMLNAAVSMHGPDSEQVHAERRRLAGILGKAKRWAESAEEYEWVLSNWHLGRPSSSTTSKAQHYRALAQAQEQLGRSEDAIASYQQAIALSSENNVDTRFASQLAIPKLMAKMGDVDGALAQLDQIIQEFHTSSGDTWLSLSGLEIKSEILRKEQRWEDAEAALRRSLAGWSKIVGELSDNTRDTRKALIEVLEAQRKFDEAIALHQEHRDLEFQEHGGETTNSLRAMLGIYNAYMKSNRLPEALACLKSASDGVLSVHGEEHPAMEKIKANIRTLEARIHAND